jgi:thiol-disulfide isomerase/thioredoxin
MKKLTIIFAMGFLCLNFSVKAQENTLIPGLQVGQPVPSDAGLSAYRGRLLILDFWATWCAPCRVLLPKADSLNRRFGGKAVILPLTYESRSVAQPVLEKLLGHALAAGEALYGEQRLHRLFPHKVIPHEVWIDAKGIVRAITEGQAVTALAINKALTLNQFPNEEKKDTRIAYNPQVPLFEGGNGGSGAAVVYRSQLSPYVPGLSGGLDISPYDSLKGQRFTLRNVPLSWLFRAAYGENNRWFSKARIRNLSRDSSAMRSPGSGKVYNDWLARGNGYCYELQLPPRLATQAFPILQAEMARLFPQYRLSVERQRVPCLVLVKTGADSLLASKGGPYLVQVTPFACQLRGATLRQLMLRLDHQYLQNYPLPLVDGTGYTGRVDLQFAAKMSDVNELNRALAPYGLALREQLAETELLVIRDNPNYLTIQP